MRFWGWLGRQFQLIVIGALILAVFLVWCEHRRLVRQNDAEMQRERVRFQYWELGENNLLERYRIDPGEALERLRVGP